MRYEIKDTEFGPNFYDADNDRGLTLADVLVLLNDNKRLADLATVNEGISREYLARETRRAEDNGRRASDMECRVMDLDRRLTETRNALTAAGVADSEPYPEDEDVDDREKSLRTGGRMLSVVERVAILARRSTPHEDPGRTAYVADLESAAKSVLSSVDDDVKKAGTTEMALALEHLRQATEGVDPRGYHDMPKCVEEFSKRGG